MNIEDIKVYLKGRMDSHLESAEVFERAMLKDIETISAIGSKVKTLKTQDEAENDLKDFQKLNYNFAMMREDFSKTLSSIKEIDTLVKFMEIDLGYSDERNKIISDISKAQASVFGVKGGEVVVLDRTVLDMIDKGMKIDKDSLGKVFSAIIDSKLK